MPRTLTTIKALKGGIEDTPLEISYTSLLAAANESAGTQGFAIGSLLNGSLEYWDGIAWISSSGSTLILGNAYSTDAGGTVTSKVRWTPDSDVSGTLNAFEVKAVSSNGGQWDDMSATAVAVPVIIKAVNDAPIIDSIPGALSVDENTTGDVIYTAHATDIDSTKISYTLSGEDAKLFAINKTTGAVTIKKALDFEKLQDADHNNQFQITVVASDGKLKDMQDLTIALGDVNEAPVITFGPKSTTLKTTTLEQHAVAIAPTIVVSEDAGNAFYSATLSLDAPGFDAQDDLLLFTNSGSGMGDIAGLYDADSGVLTLTSGFGATAAELQAALRAVSYLNTSDTPATAIHQISILVDDGAFESKVIKSQVKVTAVNDAPQFETESQSISFNENSTTVVYDALAIDPDSAKVTYSLSGEDKNLFKINGATGEITFLHTPDYEIPLDAGNDNTYHFAITASDGKASCVQSIVVNVENVVEIPPIDLTQQSQVFSDPENLAEPIVIQGLSASDMYVYTQDGNTYIGNPLSYDYESDDFGNLLTLSGYTGGIDDSMILFEDGSLLIDNSSGLYDILTGGSEGDLLIADDSGNNLIGNAGDDLLIGGLGDDMICGAGGDDTLIGDLIASGTSGSFYSQISNDIVLSGNINQIVTFTQDTTALEMAQAIMSSDGSISIVSASYIGAKTAGAFVPAGMDLPGIGIIGSGILLTSGNAAIDAVNTWNDFGINNGLEGDSDLTAIAGSVFSGSYQSYDASVLTITFTADLSVTNIGFNIIFGSEEYPEYMDSFVDIAGVFIDGINYANFDGDAQHPLSVLSANVNAGYFVNNNDTSAVPLEYDGISKPLHIVGALNSSLTTHTIKIAVADTGDHILDSGLFISNINAVASGGSTGVTLSSNDTLCGGSGNDEVYGGSGSDVFVYDSTADNGDDTIYDFENGFDLFEIANITNAGEVLTNEQFNSVVMSIVQSSEDTAVTFSNGDTVTLVGITASTITYADFIGAA